MRNRLMFEETLQESFSDSLESLGENPREYTIDLVAEILADKKLDRFDEIMVKDVCKQLDIPFAYLIEYLKH